MANEAAHFLRALSNPARLMIVCELHKGERTVSALRRLVGLGQSPLSQHLARLRNEGMVSARREGVTVHYRLADPRVTRVAAALYDVFCIPARAPADRPTTAKEHSNVR